VKLATSANNGALTAPVTCSSCGHTGVPTGRGHCSNPKCKKWVARNSGALIHGGRRAQPLANVEGSELFQAWAADLGGVENLTAGQRVVLSRTAEADEVCKTAFDYLRRTRTSLTADRTQKALSTLFQHSSTVFRGASLLGLERRSKPVDPLRAVARAVEEANR